MDTTVLLFALMVMPGVSGSMAIAWRTPARVLAAMCAGVLMTALIAAELVWRVFSQGPAVAAGGWLRVDALSAGHLALMLLIYSLSSIYAYIYFREEWARGHLGLRQSRIFTGLWCASLMAMLLVLVSNHLGIMWVGIEATTLVTAYLICIHQTRQSLEAMWKYLLICSVGVAFGFMGTLLAAASARGLRIGENEVLLWTSLRAVAEQLNPSLMKAAFICLLVGYGTKAGLAPMHSWLPDAHSQAPAPVSALFSGFMLNTALYCVMRFLPIAEAATGHAGWGQGLLTGFGVVSITVAAAFIVFQSDLKRLLAYCSVEHLGIIALGLGIGGLGTFAALFHAFNHAVCKTVSFCAAGRLGQIYGTYEMSKMGGTLRRAPVWGAGLFGSLLGLMGAAPLALFISEFLILKAAVDKGCWVAVIVLLAGGGVIFVSMLGRAIPLAWGKSELEVAPVSAKTLEVGLVAVSLGMLIILGVWMPGPFRHALEASAGIIQAVRQTVSPAAPGAQP